MNARAVGLGAGLLAVGVWAAWIAAARFSVADGLGSGGGPTVGPAPFTPVDVAFLRTLGPALLFAPFWLRPSLRESFAPAATPLWALPMLLAWGAPFVVLIGIGLGRADTVLGAALAPGLMPLLAALLAAALFRAPPSRGRALGLGLIALGAAVTLGARLTAGGSLEGAGYIAAAALAWAAYAAAFAHAGLAPMRAAGLVGGWSALAAGAAILLGAESRLAEAPAATLALGFLGHGVAAGAVSVAAFSLAIARLGATRAAALAALTPGLAALIGWVWLGDAVGLGEAAGLALASLGVWIVTAGPEVRGRR